MTIDQISVFVENRPGHLAEITQMLGDAGIDLRALSIAETADFGILRIIVRDPAAALELLKKENVAVSVTKVLAVEIDDVPGSLSKALRVLADANISVEYIYAFIKRKSERAYVIFRVEDTDGATEVLAAKGIKTASPDEIYDI